VEIQWRVVLKVSKIMSFLEMHSKESLLLSIAEEIESTLQ